MKTNIKPIILVLGLGLWLLAPQESSGYYNSSTGKWLSRDPVDDCGFAELLGQDNATLSGSQGREYSQDVKNLYVFAGNAAIASFDDLGLCCLLTSDAARRSCCLCELSVVELRIDPGFIGHAFLQTLHFTTGHYPNPRVSAPARDWFSDAVRSGQNLDDSSHPYSRTRTYTACPITMMMLEVEMILHFNDKFGLSNAKARNCAGWALERLQHVGYEVPFPPNKRHLAPSDLCGELV